MLRQLINKMLKPIDNIIEKRIQEVLNAHIDRIEKSTKPISHPEPLKDYINKKTDLKHLFEIPKTVNYRLNLTISDGNDRVSIDIQDPTLKGFYFNILKYKEHTKTAKYISECTLYVRYKDFTGSNSSKFYDFIKIGKVYDINIMGNIINNITQEIEKYPEDLL